MISRSWRQRRGEDGTRGESERVLLRNFNIFIRDPRERREFSARGGGGARRSARDVEFSGGRSDADVPMVNALEVD